MKVLTGHFIKIFFVLSIYIFLGFPSKILSYNENQETGMQVKAQNQYSIQSINNGVPEEKLLDLIGKFGEKIEMYISKWIDIKFFSNSIWLKLVISFCLILMVGIFERLVRFILQQKKLSISSDEQKTSWKRFILISVEKPLSLIIWIYGGYIALYPLLFYFKVQYGTNFIYIIAQKIVGISGIIAFFWFVFLLIQALDLKLKQWTSSTENNINEMLTPIIGKILRAIVIIIGGIVIVQNLTDLELGPLLASLGIGGLAIAFAAKDSISNFFGTLTILFDKPFKIGESIVIDNYNGVVESVGFRSTRIRTVTGHLVTIPNEKLVSSILENIAQRPYIRWLTNITITYDTPPDKVERAVKIIEDILENHEGMNNDFPPRVYFNNFDDCSLNIMVVVWYHPPNYWDFQAWVQKTCLQIMKKFEAEKIEFAFPTQTVYLANDELKEIQLQFLSDKNIKISKD